MRKLKSIVGLAGLLFCIAQIIWFFGALGREIVAYRKTKHHS